MYDEWLTANERLPLLIKAKDQILWIFKGA